MSAIERRTIWKRRSMAILPVAVAVAVAVAVTLPAARAGDDAPLRPVEPATPCEATAVAARSACAAEAIDELQTSLGACFNISRPDEAGACVEEAIAERDDAMLLCDERLEARLEVCDLLGEDRYDPGVDPDAFLAPDEVAAAPNPYFPLVPGTRWVYASEEETTVVTVTSDTLEILGVECIAVRDVVRDEDGEVIEDTVDWYAQDLDGNVWYFGEIARNFEDGLLVDLEGSWRAGVDHAKPGIVMPAQPEVGHAYRQEFLLREAEDVAEVVDTAASAETDPVSCDGTCLMTREFTPIEPDATEFKFYAAGVGMILEIDPETGERNELVDHVAGSP